MAAPKKTSGEVQYNNWEHLLLGNGVPPEVSKELDKIWRTSDHVLANAVPIAVSYVRGTPWYKQTYPGIEQGIKTGMFEDERGYRTYQSQVSQLYQQYYKRGATHAEVANYVNGGKNLTQIASDFQSKALAGTISDPLKGLFSDVELHALTNEQAGIDSALGQSVSQKAESTMKMLPLFQDFLGRAPTRGEINGLVKTGTSPEQIAKQFAAQENINSFNPAIKDLFSQQEIQQMALDAAGGTTKNGKQLTDIANLASSLNGVYHTYTGEGVTRAEVMNAYKNGLTSDQIQKGLEAGAIAKSTPGFLRQIFNASELRGAAEATTGAKITPENLRLQQLVQAAPAYNQVIQQYEGRNVTQKELGDLTNSGKTADTLGREYAGGAYVKANQGDIQYALGNFGGARATDAELTALGNENAGIDTALGQQIQKKLDDAKKRLSRIFEGTLGTPSLRGVGGNISTSSKPSDTGA